MVTNFMTKCHDQTFRIDRYNFINSTGSFRGLKISIEKLDYVILKADIGISNDLGFTNQPLIHIFLLLVHANRMVPLNGDTASYGGCSALCDECYIYPARAYSCCAHIVCHGVGHCC